MNKNQRRTWTYLKRSKVTHYKWSAIFIDLIEEKVYHRSVHVIDRELREKVLDMATYRMVRSILAFSRERRQGSRWTGKADRHNGVWGMCLP
jgi:hypothetical protein